MPSAEVRKFLFYQSQVNRVRYGVNSMRYMREGLPFVFDYRQMTVIFKCGNA